jgi:hypothetical protein
MSKEKDTIFTPDEIVDMIQQGQLDRTGAKKLIQDYTEDQVARDPIRVKLEDSLKMFQRLIKDTIGVFNDDNMMQWSQVHGIDQYQVDEAIELSETKRPMADGQILYDIISDKYECFILMAMDKEFDGEIKLSMSCHSSTMADLVAKSFVKYEPLKDTAINVLEDMGQEDEVEEEADSKDPWIEVCNEMKDDLEVQKSYWAALRNDKYDIIITATFGLDNKFHADSEDHNMGIKIHDIIEPTHISEVDCPDYPYEDR